jgi:hypothetical protein
MTLTSAGQDILSYIASSTGGSLVTAGTNGFYGFMPTSPDTCATIYIYGGEPPDVVAEDFEIQGVQVKVRGETYALGYALINDIYEALHGLTDVTINNKKYYYTKATSSVMQMGFDELKRPLFVVNFKIIKQFDNV